MRKGMRAAVIAAAAVAVASCGAIGHDAEQLVKKDPSTVYQAFAGAFEEGAMGGASQYSNLWNGGYQVFVNKRSATKLDVVTKFDGKTSSEVHFTFTPKDGGKATLVDADVAVDTAVMRKAFVGTPKENLANIPEPAFKQGMQRMMAKYAERIEAGMPLNSSSEGWQTAAMDLPPEFYEGMSDEQRAAIRQHGEEERQDAASAPTLDPDAAAKNYLGAH
jgi:hypothetical protein